MSFREHLFGIPVTTHRLFDDDHEGGVMFQYELLIAAASITFFRSTLYHSTENVVWRWVSAILLGMATYTSQPYSWITAGELSSYGLSFAWSYFVATKKDRPTPNWLNFGLSALVSLTASYGLCCYWGSVCEILQLLTPSFVVEGLSWLLPIHEVQAAYDILSEFSSSKKLLNQQIARLFYITFHIQVGMGYLGINFLNKEQERRNQLVRMDMVGPDDDEAEDSTKTKPKNGNKASNASKTVVSDEKKMKRSKKFQRSAAPFIFFTAVPYMLQIIGYGNLNAFAFTCFKNDIHRSVRLYELFDHDNHLVAVASHSAKGPDAYAGYIDTVVQTTYDLFNRKLFSLPKVLLLPWVMAKQPQLLGQIFPIIFFTDWMKGRAVAYMTTRIEHLEKETQELSAMRSKVESFDIKNAELLQRAGPGATTFTRKRWEDLTTEIQTKTVVKDLTSRTKMFFEWIQRNFVFGVLVDCALAHLIAVGKIVAAEIFVFSRAIEDAVDMALMRSRSEAELARMMTQVDNLKELVQVWDDAKTRNLLNCNVGPSNVPQRVADGDSLVVVRHMHYSRGTATVRADHLELKAGVYALTGPNGSGKSTLFRVLMSCDTNERSIDLPPSIVLSTPFEGIIEEDDINREISCEASDAADEDACDEDKVEVDPADADARKLVETGKEIHPKLSITMPSSHVAEISQTFYWPLYSKPIDWIYQEHITDTCDNTDVDQRARRVAEELHSLQFTQMQAGEEQEGEVTAELGDSVSSSPTTDAIQTIMNELLEEKEDWFSDLSGGQKSKVELVRKVFLHDECPHVLLIDETMAPLDPTSKSLVMSKLKNFCKESVMIVIYHTDVGRGQEDSEGELVECVPSNDFFDGNIHVEDQMIHLRPVC